MLLEALVLVLGELSTEAVAQSARETHAPRDDGAPKVASPVPPPALDSGPRLRVYGGGAVGKGLRFNNPYRLETQLGSTAESLSLSATYVDLFAGVAVGKSGNLQQGAVVHVSVATDGISQQVIAPSYALLVQPAARFWVGGRVGLPIVVQPDANVGLEVGAFAAVFATAGVALTAELVGSLFYGAATLDAPRTAIPVMGLQFGALFDYEVMP